MSIKPTYEELEKLLKEREHELSITKEELKQVGTQHAEQSHLLKSILNSYESPVFSLDSNFCYTSFNQAHVDQMKTIYGANIRVGSSVFDYMTNKDDRKSSKLNLEKVLQGNTVVEEAYYGGEVRRHYEVIHNPIKASANNIIGISVFVRDITEGKKLEVELRQANLVVERSPVVLFRWKAVEGWPVEMVSSNVKQFGYEAKELLSGEVPFSAIVHPDDLERITQEVTEYSASGVEDFAHEYRIVSPAGEIFWLDDRTTIERDSGGNITHYQGVVIDITERKQIEEKLKYLATHDSLTKLINRSSMEEQLENELLRAARYNHALSIFLLDLDHFKSVNDTYGHQVGDAVLQKVSRVIESLIRKIDYAGRCGGEEFVIILPETSIGKAELLAERMCTQIAEHSILIENDDKLNITASIGIASFPEHGKSWSEIVSAADSAMYAAKDAGRNCVRTAKTTVRNHS